MAATCEDAGLTEGSHCAVCGEILAAQEIVPALGHDLELGDPLTYYESTCTNGYLNFYWCNRCRSYMELETPPLWHTTLPAGTWMLSIDDYNYK